MGPARMQRTLIPAIRSSRTSGDGQWLLICERRTSGGGIVRHLGPTSAAEGQEAALIASEQRMRVRREPRPRRRSAAALTPSKA